MLLYIDTVQLRMQNRSRQGGGGVNEYAPTVYDGVRAYNWATLYLKSLDGQAAKQSQLFGNKKTNNNGIDDNNGGGGGQQLWK